MKKVLNACPHLGEYDVRRKFYQCTHKDKEPGLYLCVKVETCPLFDVAGVHTYHNLKR